MIIVYYISGGHDMRHCLNLLTNGRVHQTPGQGQTTSRLRPRSTSCLLEDIQIAYKNMEMESVVLGRVLSPEMICVIAYTT